MTQRTPVSAETPRTDSFEVTGGWVGADFARKLERELAAANAARQEALEDTSRLDSLDEIGRWVAWPTDKTVRAAIDAAIAAIDAARKESPK